MRGIDNIKGSLILDEVQREDIGSSSFFHKILAIGSGKEGVINRNEKIGTSCDFKQRSFSVFGPKIFSGRSISPDEAILSRIFEIRMPLYDKGSFEVSSLSDSGIKNRIESIRNDLLLYRQRRRVGEIIAPGKLFNKNIIELKLSMRQDQVFSWMLKECPTPDVWESLSTAIIKQIEMQESCRVLSFEYEVLAMTWKLLSQKKILVKEIAENIKSAYGYSWLESKKVTNVLRNNGITLKPTNEGRQVLVSREALTKIFKLSGYPIPDKSLASLPTPGESSKPKWE